MAEMTTGTITFYAIAGGFLPALLWLWFWLKEDRAHPEPRQMIIKSFLAGGISVFFAFLVQNYYINHIIPGADTLTILTNDSFTLSFFLSSIPIFLAWALTEEICKFLAVYLTSLKTTYNDEPIDPMIYMIVGALGFVAIENTFFILDTISSGDTIDFLITGNLRFLGASLVHIVSSAIVGAAMSLSYCYSKAIRFSNTLFGLILATLLHALFNFFIITINNVGMFKIFLLWWIIAIILLVFFEKVKRIVCTPSFKEKIIN